MSSLWRQDIGQPACGPPEPKSGARCGRGPLLSWMRRTRNGACNARPLGDSYRLYVVWDPPDDPTPAPLMVRSPAARLDHARREGAAARRHDLPAEAVERPARTQERERE